ncbi:MAG: hypothetical protein KY476_02480 [Planctomycetes bacterium]|nr:hypothetical protein [Planctomycetota bacterium]
MISAAERLRVLVLGYVVRCPLGGMAWHYLQYALGLARLGHDVYFLEDSDDYPGCYDPVRHVTDTDPTCGLKFADDAFRRIGLPDRWAYFDAHTRQWQGPCAGFAVELCESADVLLNVSGSVPLRGPLREVEHRAWIDTDPVFTQIRHLCDPGFAAKISAHTAYFTFGENAGTAGKRLPDDGLVWRPTRQPVVLDVWPHAKASRRNVLTTVMQWDSYPAREFGGVRYGMKSDSFQLVLDLPSRTDAEFELALGSPTAPRELLRSHGWRIIDPLQCTRDPWTYQRYLLDSLAEFSVAKHGYVVSNSGWFSERSACYLACGRPVVCQDTGFSAHLPTGEGLFAYRTVDEAVAAVDEVRSRYAFHCRRAREIAEEYFDSGRILSDLLRSVLEAPAPSTRAAAP